MNEEPRPPRQREIPRYAPVVFDDTEEYADEPYEDEYDDRGPVDEPPRPPRPPRRGGRGPGGNGAPRGPGDYASDAGLLRVMALIAFLGFVILALVLPWSPIRVVGGGGDDDGDIGTEARSDLPNLPPGLVALSKMYDITIPEDMDGPWTIEVKLDQQTEDARNLAYYAYEDGTWQRLVSVELAADGTRVSGVLSEAPGSIAVLRRETTAANLGLLLNAGEQPDPAALNGATALAVRAATVAGNGELTVDTEGASMTLSGAGSLPAYLGVTGDAGGALGSAATITAHAEAIAEAVDAGQYAGAYLEYAGVSNGGALASLVTELATLLGEERGVIVGVPSGEAGAYDWEAILAAAEGIWLRPPDDPTTYYDEVEGVLREQYGNGIDMRQVWLVVDRRSTASTGNAIERISLQAALTPASAVDRGIEGGISTGDPVTLRAVNLETNPAGPALTWDPETRTVTYAYDTDDGERTIWIENRFSVAFRLEVAQRYGLGGVVVDAAGADPQLPAIWESVLAFIEEGDIALEQPFGPYLVPCWEASAGDIEGAPECWQSPEPGEAVVWRAPSQPGAYEIRLIVSDGTVFVGQELALNVANGAAPTPPPTDEEPEPEDTEEPPEPEETEEPVPEETEEPADEEPDDEPTTEPEPEETEDLPPGPAGDEEE